jgi:hypothetical protein
MNMSLYNMYHSLNYYSFLVFPYHQESEVKAGVWG